MDTNIIYIRDTSLLKSYYRATLLFLSALKLEVKMCCFTQQHTVVFKTAKIVCTLCMYPIYVYIYSMFDYMHTNICITVGRIMRVQVKCLLNEVTVATTKQICIKMYICVPDFCPFLPCRNVFGLLMFSHVPPTTFPFTTSFSKHITHNILDSLLK